MGNFCGGIVVFGRLGVLMGGRKISYLGEVEGYILCCVLKNF